MGKVLLCDASWMAHKYYYSYSKLGVTNTEGKFIPTGMAYAFTDFVSRVVLKGEFQDIVICLDSKSDYRRELDPDYKKGRAKLDEAFLEQFTQSLILLSMSGRVKIRRSVGMEADDLIAMQFFEYHESGYEVVIHSSDNDMLQLVPYGAKVAKDYRNGVFSYYDEDYVKEKYGVSFKELIFYRILVGDSSDRIPPIWPRMSREKSRELARKWSEVGSILKAIDLWEGDKVFIERVRSNIERVRLNISLMNLVKYRKKVNRLPSINEKYEGGEVLIREFEMKSWSRYLRKYEIS